MASVASVVSVVFGAGLFVNAALFVPQALAIWRKKTADGISILTFAGFGVMQFVGARHGYLAGDLALMIGMAASFVTCTSVTVLAFIYSRRSGRSSPFPQRRQAED
jgi:MtN3 and saliva related transmembrane protein